MPSKKVLVIGAGYAGIEAALTLNKKSKKGETDILVIDKNPFHTLLTEIHEVAGNRVSEEAVRIPLSDIFADTRVKYLTDEITEFNFDEGNVKSAKAIYNYDYVIVGIGSTPNYFGIKGLKENALTLWSYEDSIKIREHIKSCFLKAKNETDPAERKKLLTFVVCGAGFTGVEMIGELANWAKMLCDENGIDRKEVRCIILDMLPRILSVLSEKNAKKAQNYLEKKLGVEVLVNSCVDEAYPDKIIVCGESIETYTIIWTAGIRSSEHADNMNVEYANGSKRILVDEYLRIGKYKNAYAVGDVGGLLDKKGRPFPAMVETALYTGKSAAMNIIRDIRKQEPVKADVKLHGVMVSIGNYYAVSDIMGRELPGWLSLLMKYMVNVHYLFGIMGFKGVSDYLRHEVLFRRQKKSFLEKHYTRTVQAWWMFLLRLFLGYTWLYEGIKKVTSGWLSEARLASFLGVSPSGADTVSAATGDPSIVSGIGKIFVDINAKLLHLRIGQMESIIGGVNVEGEMFAKVQVLHFGDFDLVDWIVRNIVVATDGVAMFFQVLVVIAEIAIGLMFLAGAFNFAASIISIGLMAMFITSTGIYDYTWWIPFASIAVMGGAGRAFGLDYWILPYLTRVWDSWRKNGKLRLSFPRKGRKAGNSGKV